MLALCHGESARKSDCGGRVDRSLAKAREWRPKQLVCRHHHLSDERTRCRSARDLYQEALGDKSLCRAGVVSVPPRFERHRDTNLNFMNHARSVRLEVHKVYEL